MSCPYARFIEHDLTPPPTNESNSTVSSKLTLNGTTATNDALTEILSLTGYDNRATKPELKRLPSSDELVTYHNYLQLEKILDAQTLLSAKHDINKSAVHDEHLFIIIHQAFELWFKQIIYEIDSIREIFDKETVDESHMFVIVNRLNRCVQIWHLLVDQIGILETMTPLDFMEFRSYLSPASGFQSLQFRLIENKFGLTDNSRIQYNNSHYTNIFPSGHDRNELQNSVDEPTLLQLIERWLERTPGLEDKTFNFWESYKRSVGEYFKFLQTNAEDEPNPTARESSLEDAKKTADIFRSIFDEKFHNQLVQRGDRRISHRAMQGALMVSLYREQPRFQQPYQIISLLMDIDALITKWRYGHLILVQRQIGNKQGTGGSAGYSYLRSTCSDRYKVFIDLFNISAFLIPRGFLPKLSDEMKVKLSVASVIGTQDTSSTMINKIVNGGSNNDDHDGIDKKSNRMPNHVFSSNKD
ncbi:unnamed protein product [Didymodactylos carnosus]|uniref:Tryptophan 2,3-dioxygenase n=1 Tax=Didymodactylos carnosus TaxID=1234261 RepID=A0A813ZFV7_9BILA|nr:unnamed protein product [Didymodactylos carnosus]CAF0927671.1 unnamed protein product [Didymodactylos carnosus]CAF3681113.1 unnamed protein product [Didymodactylos carnosus]CAF3704609.1 unnamed protein product [Didymodactylos carnosus]